MGSEIYRQQVFKFGHGHNLQIGDLPTDLWEGSAGLYPFQTKPIPLFASSASALDVGIPVQLEGLDENGIIQRKVFVLNGQNKVSVPGLWWRQYRAVNADGGQEFAGEIYIYSDDTIAGGVPETPGTTKILIETQFQQTQMLVYTIPRDYEAEMCCFFISLVPKNTSAAFANIGMYMRQPGKTWTNQAYLGLMTSGTSAIQLSNLQLAGIINPMTDIVVRATGLSASGLEVAGFFSLKFTRKVS